MKKLAAGGICLLLAAGAAFAEFPQFHLGAGLYTGITGDTTSAGGRTDNGSSFFTIKDSATSSGIGLGFFVDVTYAELAVGIGLGNQTQHVGSISMTLGGISSPVQQFALEEFSSIINVSLLLKWPVEIEQLAVFPLLGFEITGVTSSVDYERKSLGDTSYAVITLDIGAGADFFMGKNLFIRSSLLGGMSAKTGGPSVPAPSTWTGAGEDGSISFNQSFRYAVRFALGWRFF